LNNDKIKKSALIIATLNSFITPFMGSSVNIALPAIEKEFKVDAVILSWIATAYLLAVAVSLVPFGRIADIYGRKKVFTWGILLFTVSSILSAVSFSVPMLIFFRIAQGIGNAMVFATGIAIIVSVYPPQERGRVLGINVAAVYIGLSVGPFLGGILTQYFTWRSVFIATVPLALIIIFLIFSRLKEEWADAEGEKFDYIGSFIYGVAIIGIIYGITIIPSIRSIWVISVGSIGLFAFIIWELRVKAPVFQIRLFRKNRVFAFSSLAALINYSATFALTFLLSLYLQYIKVLSPKAAGLVLMAQPVVMAISSPFAGRLSDRIEPRIVATLGMMVTTVGLIPLIFLKQGTSVAYIIVCLFFLGLGFGLFSSPNTNAIMSSVEKRFFGTASGAVGTMRSLGMMVSMGIATVIFNIYMGRSQINPQQYYLLIKSIKVAFAVSTILCFVGVFASFARGDLKTAKQKVE
jgi:EmrB/QacA subfamily drug resistance transporter